MKMFNDYYVLHSSTNNWKEKFQKNPEGKKCRFCRKAYPHVEFEKKPHVLPELFGKNNITSNFECDNCNKKAQKYETDVATMINHNLTLLNLKSKHKVPNFQSIKHGYDKSTTLETLRNQRVFNFEQNLDDFQIDRENKTFAVNFRTKVFSPFSVYKIFLKMGISLLSNDEIQQNRHYLEFYDSETPIYNGMQVWRVFKYRILTRYFEKPSINLYRAKNTLVENNAFPEYVLIIHFANIVYQFFLPLSNKNILENDGKGTLYLELFPFPVYEYIDKLTNGFSIDFLDLDETKKMSINDNIQLSFKDIVSVK